MSDSMMPRYPIYIPSRQRHATPYTARLFHGDGLPFKMVVEPQERALYESLYGPEHVLTLDKDNQGLIYVRNWIKAHSVANGE